MIRTHPPRDLQQAGYVARAYTLRDVALADLNASRRMPFNEALGEALAGAIVNCQDSSTASLDDSEATLVVQVKFSVTAKEEHGEGPEILSVGGAFDLRYERQWEEAEVNDDDIQTFARVNGVYNAWPYLREVVASTFGRLGYPPYTLSSLVIVPKAEEEPEAIPSSAE